MGRFLRAFMTSVALAAVALGCALITGFGLGGAQAAGCTSSPVTDKMNVSLTPDANVRAFANLKASFSGAISNGHCAGDSFSFAIPPTLKAQDGAKYPLKAPDGSVVAYLVIKGRTATVTLTDYVETHRSVHIQGFFDARIDDSTSPGGTDNIVWDINGKTSTPVKMGSCPGCSGLPKRTTKNGAPVSPGELSIAVNTIATTAANQVFTFTDRLTSPGQSFDCPFTATADLYTSRTQWGSPIITRRGLPVDITSCIASSVSGKLTVPSKGMAARINLHVTITDPNQASYDDTATVVTNGHGQDAATSVQSYSGGGSGVGTVSPSSGAGSSSISRTTTTPASNSSSAAGSSLVRTTSSSNGALPTAINGGGGQTSSSNAGVLAGLALLAGGLLGLGVLAVRTGLLGGRARHAHR